MRRFHFPLLFGSRSHRASFWLPSKDIKVRILYNYTFHFFSQHANGENPMIGIDGNSGEITDMKELGVSKLLFKFVSLAYVT